MFIEIGWKRITVQESQLYVLAWNQSAFDAIHRMDVKVIA
jgi:hypothetical protein